MKKFARRSALALAATVATVGLVAIDAPAHADTGWGWRVVPHPHGVHSASIDAE